MWVGAKTVLTRAPAFGTLLTHLRQSCQAVAVFRPSTDGGAAAELLVRVLGCQGEVSVLDQVRPRDKRHQLRVCCRGCDEARGQAIRNNFVRGDEEKT